jgi:hypothetical protein
MNVCPECGSFLLKNKIKSEWCSNLNCNYHLHGGKLVTFAHKERMVFSNTNAISSVSNIKIADIIKKFSSETIN